MVFVAAPEAFDCGILPRMRTFILMLLSGFFLLVIVTHSTSIGAQEKNQKTDHYRKWLEEDVVYIITEEERAVFLKLTTDEERDQFIEQFWARRNPDPNTPENGFKEDHYRRIQYANERFSAGIPGWRTDRGRVYIEFGPPDRIESHPIGGPYQRKAQEGGGSTSTYPFEIWEYRHIDGVGDDIELEFVNDVGGNLYRLTMDPQDKDELLHVPGMGLTDAEMFDPAFNGQKSWERVNRVRASGDARIQGIHFEREKDKPFAKAELLSKISAPPVIRFNDLREKVTARVTYNFLPFRVISHFVRVDGDTSVVSVTLSFDPQALSFRSDGDLLRSQLQVYGSVTTLTKRTIYEFDDDIVAEYVGRQVESIKETQTYQRKLALKSGKYKLDLIVRDSVSGKMGTTAIGIEVPPIPKNHLTTSSVILANSIEPAQSDLTNPYIFGIYKIKPQVDREFSSGDSLGFYVEAYDYQLDQSTLEPALQVKYGFASPGGEPSAFKTITEGLTMAADRVYLARWVSLGGLEKGRHELVFVVTDTLSGQSTMARAAFEIR